MQEEISLLSKKHPHPIVMGDGLSHAAIHTSHWYISSHLMAAWRSGSIVGRINEVTLRRARLVLGWVTIFGG